MSVTVVPTLGRQGQINERSSATRHYFARDAADENAACGAVYNYLVANSETTLTIGTRTLVLKNIQVQETIIDGYECEVSYGDFQTKPRLQEGESSFSFEIGIQPIRILVPAGSNTVYKRTSDTGSLPTIHLIGDQGIPGEEPAGVEVYEPTHTEQERHIVAASTISSAYKQTVKSIIGKTNNASFKGHDAGECLLQSVSGQQRGSSDWDLNFRWAIRENQSNITIQGITGISKKGWQYLWPIRMLGKDESGAKKLVSQIRYIVVSDVFREVDYSGLGI